MSKTKTKKIKTPASKISFIVFGIFYIITMVILIACTVGGSSQSEYLNNANYVYDYENYFTESEQTKINNTCKSVASKSKLAVFVATTKRDYSIAEMNGEEFCYKNNFSVYDTFVVLILNKDNAVNSSYHFDIYTFGKAESKITEHEIDAILYSKYGNEIIGTDKSLVVDGINGTVQKCAVAFSFILPKTSWVAPCIVALILSALIAFLVNLGVKKSYSRKRANQTYSLRDNGKLNLTNQTDQYVTSTITSVVIRDDSSSGSHGGGHSSGGGGGMGHRGGR